MKPEIDNGLEPKYFIKETTFFLHGMDHGWGNGYVCVYKDHPIFEKGYDELYHLDCHGGLTFSIHGSEIKDWPECPGGRGTRNWWIIGFDCNHYGDDQYSCSKEYVENQAINLLEQVKNYEIKM